MLKYRIIKKVILHDSLDYDQAKYAISNLEENDIARRNTIAQLISDWGLVTIENKNAVEPMAPLRQIKIISFKDKNNWELSPKYNIGRK